MPEPQWCLHCGKPIRRGAARRWQHVDTGLAGCIAETDAEPGLD